MVTTMRPRGAERRRHRRIDTDLDATCRRIGGRPTPERPVRVLDISQGGIRLGSAGHFLTGDVVLVTVQVDGRDLTLKGLIVSASVDLANTGSHLARVAFTAMATADRDRLGRLLEQLERAEAAH